MFLPHLVPSSWSPCPKRHHNPAADTASCWWNVKSQQMCQISVTDLKMFWQLGVLGSLEEREMVKSPGAARFTFLCTVLTIPLALITHIWTRLLNPCLQLRYFPWASLLANPPPLTSKQMQVAFAPRGFGLCAKLDFVSHTPSILFFSTSVITASLANTCLATLPLKATMSSRERLCLLSSWFFL